MLQHARAKPSPNPNLRVPEGLSCAYHDSRSCCYYGQSVLSFAACVGGAEICKLLLSMDTMCGEDGTPSDAVREPDILGNTPLHCLVIFISEHPKWFEEDVIQVCTCLLWGLAVKTKTENSQLSLMLRRCYVAIWSIGACSTRGRLGTGEQQRVLSAIIGCPGWLKKPLPRSCQLRWCGRNDVDLWPSCLL